MTAAEEMQVATLELFPGSIIGQLLVIFPVSANTAGFHRVD